MLPVLFGLLIGAVPSACFPQGWQPWGQGNSVGAAVNTTSGTIIGHAAAVYPDVSEYLGIPFAQPPLGALRFAAPQPFQSSGTLVADTEPQSCLQNPATVNYSQPENWQNIQIASASFRNHTSEDCLFLNVWTKLPSQGQPLKPVMIWFYGGGFHSGGAADSSQDLAIFAEEEDVVMVNFNYRLSILGFSGAPAQTQNVGLLDQRLAIEWVRGNIAGFGGDPARITLFGHSAGGASIDFYDFAWTDDPIIAASIPMSGSVTSFGNRFPNTTADAWYETSKLVGCGSPNTTSDAAILECMRQVDGSILFPASQNASDIIIAELAAYDQLFAGIIGIFGPTIDNKTVFENYTVLGQAGQFIKTPTLLGSNNDEGCYFAETGVVATSDEADLTAGIFTCAMNRDAMWRAQVGLPVWKYRFYGAYPNLYAPACPGQPWHGSELDVMFNSTNVATGEAATSSELQMGAYFRKTWAAFARDPTSGLSQLGWPTFNTNEGNLVELGMNSSIMAVESAVDIDAVCFSEFVSGAPDL